MFWAKKSAKVISIISGHGEFVWDGTFGWECDVQHDGQSIHLLYVGGRFDLSHLPRFDAACSNLPSLILTALESTREEIAQYDHGAEQMTLAGITVDPSEADEDFQLDFSFANWPDGNLTVHFKDDSVIASHIDD